MSLFDDMKGLLAQYASGAAPAGDAGVHFEQVAQSVDANALAHGIAEAMRSDQTPPFAQIVSQLFASASGEQKVAILNTLLSNASPAQRAQIAKLIPGLGAGDSVTTAEATAVTPAAVQDVARRVEQESSGIVDKMSKLYAAHPTLVRTLGTAAMMIAMRKIAERHG